MPIVPIIAKDSDLGNHRPQDESSPTQIDLHGRTPIIDFPLYSTPSFLLNYAGVYSRSGLDVMGILIRTFSRPHPQVHLGPVDTSCSFLICDMSLPDMPIIYASEPFSQMTGYTTTEVVGMNPRFMQAPAGWEVREYRDGDKRMKESAEAMKKVTERRQEIQLKVINFKKSGRSFVNLLTMIPVSLEGEEIRYCVGFQAEITG